MIHIICLKIHWFTEHFAPATLTCIDPIWSNAWPALIQFDPMWFNLIQSNPIWSTLIHSRVQSDPIWPNLTQFDPFYFFLFQRARNVEYINSSSIFSWQTLAALIQYDQIWPNLIHFFLYSKGQETLDTSIHRAFRASKLKLHFSRTISGSAGIKRWTNSCLRIIKRIQMPAFSDRSSPPHGRHPHCYLSRRKTPVRIGWHVSRNSEYHGGRFFEIKVDTVKAASGKDLYQVV